MPKHVIAFFIGILFSLSLSAQAITVTVVNYNPSLYQNQEIFLCFKQGDQPGKQAQFFELRAPEYLYQTEQIISLDILKATVFYIFLKNEPNVALQRNLDADNLDSITITFNRPSCKILRNPDKLPVIEITTQEAIPSHEESSLRPTLRRAVS